MSNEELKDERAAFEASGLSPTHAHRKAFHLGYAATQDAAVALAKARSALYAIAKTYDDEELRTRALEAYEATFDAARAAQPPAAEWAMPVGWKMVRVNEHFDALIAVLEREESKGYLPDSVSAEWENFACDENVAASTSNTVQPAAEEADVGHACIERLRKTMTRLGIFPGEGVEWFAANLERNLYSIDRAINALLDSITAPASSASDPLKELADKQKPLPSDFARVLYDNLDNLYLTDNASDRTAEEGNESLAFAYGNALVDRKLDASYRTAEDVGEDGVVKLTPDEMDALTRKRFSNMHAIYYESFRKLMREAIEANDQKHLAPANKGVNLTKDQRRALRRAIVALDRCCYPMETSNALESILAVNKVMELTDEQIDRLVVSSCHSDPRDVHGNYVLTVSEVRVLLSL